MKKVATIIPIRAAPAAAIMPPIAPFESPPDDEDVPVGFVLTIGGGVMKIWEVVAGTVWLVAVTVGG